MIHTISPRGIPSLLLALLLALVASDLGAQGPPPPPPPPPPVGPLPPPPVPPENPLTAQKSVLGKILFWDAQLSADDTVACGTCHMPDFGGSDPRATSLNPGPDLVFGNANDVHGSLGVARLDASGAPLLDPLYGWDRQVTSRRSQSLLTSASTPLLFWDGRATGPFIDPESGAVLIPVGGALESQALVPILSSVEMSHPGRTWDDVRSKLQVATPLFHATDLPADVSVALAANPTYPALFQAAFGTPDINAARIAFALASYQRTLVTNDAPIDDFLQFGPTALTPEQNAGNQLFAANCFPCHNGPLQTDNTFRRIGVRPPPEDLGRGAITGQPVDNGRFKVPSLRNVALRAPYFHNGGKATLAEVIDFYNVGGDFPNPAIDPLGLTANQQNLLENFLATVLTDPRVAAGVPPFDRPTLRPYFRRGDANGDEGVDISDAIALLETLFAGGQLVNCEDAADANDDGQLNVADAITILGRLFSGDPPLPAPSDRSTGPDPTPDPLGC
ncbi:MAG: cytochrome c peroxidase [Planctomycetota bacterium]